LKYLLLLFNLAQTLIEHVSTLYLFTNFFIFLYSFLMVAFYVEKEKTVTQFKQRTN